MSKVFPGLFVPAIIVLLLVSCSKKIQPTVIGTLLNTQDTVRDWLWKDIDYKDVTTQGQSLLLPHRFRYLELNTAGMHGLLASTLGASTADQPLYATVPLPLPDSGFVEFIIRETPTMDPALQAKFPRLRTYGGKGIDDPTATAKLDFMPTGFHAYLFTTKGSVLIHPLSESDTLHYLCYYKHHSAEVKHVFEESIDTTQFKKP